MYLFILSPGYSGSTVLYKLLNTSPNISTLLSKKNPSHVGEGCALFHMTEEFKIKDYLKIRLSSVKLPMDFVKKAYETIWDLNKPILCDKSIPTLYRAQQYKTFFSQFGKVYFISLIRNPYYIRGKISDWHRDACVVKKNIEEQKDCILHISYEELTNDLDLTIRKILNFLPALGSLNKSVGKTVGIRDVERNKSIKNYNKTPRNLSKKNIHIKKNKKLRNIMDYFGYNFIKR